MPAPPETRRRPDRGDALVAAQLLSIAALGWPGPARWRLPWPVTLGALTVGAAGTVLMEEGLRFLGRDVTPFVDPRPSAALQTAGPYAWSRNPVYAGMLVTGAAAAVLRRRPEPLIALAALSAALHLKVGAEERRLRERFGVAYEEYAARTPRLIGAPSRP
jgi:protein-S-isoprenylcysteine O-methyltransferase Ste14